MYPCTCPISVQSNHEQCWCMPEKPYFTPNSIFSSRTPCLQATSVTYHHSYLGPSVPFVSFTPGGSRAPACHCTRSGALGCRFRASADILPRKFTCAAGHTEAYSLPDCPAMSPLAPVADEFFDGQCTTVSMIRSLTSGAAGPSWNLSLHISREISRSFCKVNMRQLCSGSLRQSDLPAVALCMFVHICVHKKADCYVQVNELMNMIFCNLASDARTVAGKAHEKGCTPGSKQVSSVQKLKVLHGSGSKPPASRCQCSHSCSCSSRRFAANTPPGGPEHLATRPTS